MNRWSALMLAAAACSDRVVEFTADDASSGECVGTDCTSTCGDGVRDPGEQCDDGTADGRDGCNEFCLVPGSPVGPLSTSVERLEDIAVDIDGSIAVIGFDSAVNVARVLRLDAAGAALWDSAVEPEHNSAVGMAVAIAQDGDIVATGVVSGGLWVQRFSPTGETRWTASDEQGDLNQGIAVATRGAEVLVLAFVVRDDGLGVGAIQLDSAGRERSRVDFDSVGLFDGWSLAIDGSGEVWAAGVDAAADEAAIGHVDFDELSVAIEQLGAGPRSSAAGLGFTTAGDLTIAGTGPAESWVEMRTRLGESLWRWTADEPVWLLDLAIDGAGNVVVAGGNSNSRGWITKLAPDGTPSWTFVSGDDATAVESYHAVAVDTDGFVYAVGLAAGPASITKLAP
jgi:cysteine-rich repeat protein